MSGRFVGIGLDLVTQVLVVRYLSQADFGTFAYALAVVSIGSTIAAFGLDKAIARFIPLYEERGDSGKIVAAVAVAGITMALIGLAVIVLVNLLAGVGVELLADPAGILIVLIVLVPVQALQSLLTAVFAVFGRTRAIFFRQHLLTPVLQLAVVAAIVFSQGALVWLALGWVAVGIVGLAISLPLAARVVQQRGHAWERHHLRQPASELFSFSTPLLSTELVFLLRGAFVPVFLGALATAVDVAEYRAVYPYARLNLIVYQSFSVLFLPLAARFVGASDRSGLSVLHWQSTAWVAVATFPVLAATFALAPAVVEVLFGERYEASGPVMTVMALGFFLYAVLSLGGLVLRALGRVRYVFVTDVSTAVLSVVAFAVLIPPLGALGAAAGASLTMILQVVLYQLALHREGVRVLSNRYARLVATVLLAGGSLMVVQYVLAPPLAVGLIAAAVMGLVLLRIHREALSAFENFPELRRIPLMSRLLE